MMFIHTLCKAIENVGWNHGPTCMTFRHYGNASWKRDLAEAMFCVIGKGLSETDPDVVLIKSAIRQMHQSGEIHWDVPSTPEEIAGAAPFVREIKHYSDKWDRKRSRMAVRDAKRTLYLLTDEQKLSLRTPLAPKNLSRSSKSAMKHFTHTEDGFRFEDLGIGYANENSNEIVNRLIQLGILDLIKPGVIHPEWPTAALVQLGPRYVAYMEKFNLFPRHGEHWERWKTELEEKWKI